MRTRWCALALVGLFGCGEEEMMPPPPTPGPATSTAKTGKPKATATATATAASGKVCKVVERKVWVKGANPRTGLTPRDLGAKQGIGLAVGNRPHQLVFDDKGQGKLERLALVSGHGLAKGVPLGDGIRHLQRITLTRGSRSFADYRDKYEDGRRRIACGPLDRKEPYLFFEGKPLLSTDDSGKGRDKTPTTKVPSPAASASASATAAPSAAPSVTASASASVPAPSASAPPPPPPTPTPTGSELRDCRTFSDAAGNDIFAVGSELYRKGADWMMRIVLVPDEATGERIELASFKLGPEPKRLFTLEAPVAERLADGSWVLAGRYRGQLLVWLLDQNKKPKADRATFAGGYPSLPRFHNDGSGVHFMLTSQQVKPSIWKLRGLRFGNPAKLSTDLFDPKPPRMAVESAAEPTVTRVREQRWMTFHEGDRRRGVIKVVPVDAQIRAIGQPYQVTTPDVAAYESVSFGAGDDLMVVYISRPNQGATELVSERLSCRVDETN